MDSGSLAGCSLLPGIAIFATQRLDDQAITDGFGSGFDSLRGAIHDRSDRLQIGLDGPFCDSTGLEANSALIFGATSIVDLSSGGGSSTSEMAATRHARASKGQNAESRRLSRQGHPVKGDVAAGQADSRATEGFSSESRVASASKQASSIT